nr:hypothetical protein Iba_chr01aCG15440 [Ipomoea batatas]GMC52235.1 hypothetical protein Iba_chr01cCG13660 [Ipomoea batatas]GMC54923.1 hypothetical protein Iba_chr01eCG2520 [Ipomoea batatas]GMC56044.1 hypothetical protein Iba_chr01fCG3400 [Ipomoea batatas]
MPLPSISESLPSIYLGGVDQAGLTSLAEVLKKLRLGLLIHLRSGAKPKTSATLFCLGIHLEDMLLQNMRSSILSMFYI